MGLFLLSLCSCYSKQCRCPLSLQILHLLSLPNQNHRPSLPSFLILLFQTTFFELALRLTYFLFLSILRHLRFCVWFRFLVLSILILIYLPLVQVRPLNLKSHRELIVCCCRRPPSREMPTRDFVNFRQFLLKAEARLISLHFLSLIIVLLAQYFHSLS